MEEEKRPKRQVLDKAKTDIADAPTISQALNKASTLEKKIEESIRSHTHAGINQKNADDLMVGLFTPDTLERYGLRMDDKEKEGMMK